MDLRNTYPRSVKQKVGGYVHLARMIDKARAKAAGTLGEYIYPCPLDRRLLDFLAIPDESFLQAAEGHIDDEIVRWVHAESAPHAPDEIEGWNRAMLTRGPDTEEKWAHFRSLRDRIDPTRTDIKTWADLLDLEEGRAAKPS